jgi:hypothetical protein
MKCRNKTEIIVISTEDLLTAATQANQTVSGWEVTIMTQEERINDQQTQIQDLRAQVQELQGVIRGLEQNRVIQCQSSYSKMKVRNIRPYAPGDNDIISRRDPDPVRRPVGPDAQPRSHRFYQNPRGEDGKWHCPFKEETNCNHEPTSQKCGFE